MFDDCTDPYVLEWWFVNTGQTCRAMMVNTQIHVSTKNKIIKLVNILKFTFSYDLVVNSQSNLEPMNIIRRSAHNNQYR